jgi:hypothetical protein
MSLAGIALMRSVDTNVLVAGNLAFRQANTAYADLGIEAARAWLNDPANKDGLIADQPAGATHYMAQWQGNVDFIKATSTTADDYDWAQAASVTSPDPAFGISYAVHRLCFEVGALGTARCMTAQAGSGTTTKGGTQGVVAYGSMSLPGTSTVFYRVTVRVAGPRNTMSYVQAVLN